MGGLAALVIILVIGGLIAGPVAVILAIVLFNKMADLDRRMRHVEFKSQHAPFQRKPTPAASPPDAARPAKPTPEEAAKTEPPIPEPAAEAPTPEMPPVPEEPAAPAEPEILRPIATPPMAEPAGKPAVPKKSAAPKQPAAAAASTAAVSSQSTTRPVAAQTASDINLTKAARPSAKKDSQMEVKIGVTVALVIGVITVIVGVGFFLKYIYDKQLLSNTARVAIVAISGLAGLVIGEVIRRRDYGIVAKGITALGYALLYAAIFAGNKVYGLVEAPWAFGAAIVVTATAMLHAVTLDEIIIAFLSLLGGYLSTILIISDRIIAVQLFGYVLVLGLGAMGAAAFRRWRPINWMAFVGTYVLYSLWYIQYYQGYQMTEALLWLGMYGGIFLLLPLMHGLVKRLPARGEDVSLIVVNSITVFYYLWHILYAGYRQELGLAAGILGVVHLTAAGLVRIRCREDVNLQALTGVLGTGLVTAGIGLYFTALQPALAGWALEAVVLTFVFMRYRIFWSKIMAVLVSGIATTGLFYHLPLHPSAEFRVFLNPAFGTWVFVTAAILICHLLWRFMREETDDEAALASQVYYVWGCLLLAVGVGLEWYAYCSWQILNAGQAQSWLLMGMMVIASILTCGFFLRPICPKGDFVRLVGIMTATVATVYTGMAMLGVYYHPFRLFINLPFGCAALFAAVLFFGAWLVRRVVDADHPHGQIPSAIVTMGLILLFVVLSEQIYSYWYCRNEYGVERITDWRTRAHYWMFILWAAYGLVMLFAGIWYDKLFIRLMAAAATALSAAGLFLHVPLHSGSDFQFVFNLPFIAWVCVSLGLLTGHILWRMMHQTTSRENPLAAQVYYTVGGLLLSIGCFLEWYAHCRWQLVPADVGWAHFWLGGVFIWIVLAVAFLLRPLSPEGILVKAVGVLAALSGAVYTGYVLHEAYTGTFTLFANVPFGITVLYVVTLLGAGWHLKRTDRDSGRLPSVMVMTGLVLLWALLSKEVYAFWYCGHYYGDVDDNWRFLAQMYISVTWAIYAAVLLVIGFIFRARGIRYLSLTIFAVLLVKINLDIWHLRTEYRIATFLTTGLILVGVSFLYQFLKKKGFFDSMDAKPAESHLPAEGSHS